jgi:hypothetical protein
VGPADTKTIITAEITSKLIVYKSEHDVCENYEAQLDYNSKHKEKMDRCDHII